MTKKKMGKGLTGQHTYTGDRGLTRATTWGDESGGLYQGHHMGRGGTETLNSGPLRPDLAQLSERDNKVSSLA